MGPTHVQRQWPIAPSCRIPGVAASTGAHSMGTSGAGEEKCRKGEEEARYIFVWLNSDKKLEKLKTSRGESRLERRMRSSSGQK